MSETVLRLPIRLFLLIENCLLREALGRVFCKRPDLLVAGSSGKEECSPERLLEAQCDVLVFDFFDAKWFPTSLRLKTDSLSSLKALQIGVRNDCEQFIAAIRGGVNGFLLNEASISEVVEAVRATFKGEAVCPPALCGYLFEYVSRSARGETASLRTRRPDLTFRQQQLLALVAKGLTNKEIASRLSISEHTVKNHLRRIMKQVDAGSRNQAVETIRSHGYSLQSSEGLS